MSIQKRVVISNATGSVQKYGRTNFSGQFNPTKFSQLELLDTASFLVNLIIQYHKVVAGLLYEMTAAEKTAVDAEQEIMGREKLEGALRITRQFPNVASLPIPPPGPGYIVAVASMNGSRGLAYSTNIGWSLYQQTGAV